MIILQGKDLTKSYGVETVFSDISFIVQEGEKVGLVGPNGAGKSTIFRCLTGEETLDAGQIMLGNQYTLGYLEQIPDFSEGTTLLEAVLDMFADIFTMRDELSKLEKQMAQHEGKELEILLDNYSQLTEEYEKAGGFSCESKVRGIIKGLGFVDADLNREVRNFSGGEKTRVSLARLLVREPDLLLLDEPTNHLDLNALEWLEGFLKNYSGAVLVISHDRYFLDEVVTRILELQDNNLKSFPGNYSRYLILKAEQELAQSRAYEKQQKEIQMTEEYILKYKAGIKAKQARGREKQLNRLERVEAVKSSKSIALTLNDIGDTGELVLLVENISMAYSDKLLFSNLSFTVNKGEKIGLIGGNGVGKSTILKIITEQVEPQNGLIRLGSRVKLAYFDQEHGNIYDKNRVIDEIMFNFQLNEKEARNMLAQVMFYGDDVFKAVGDLSGGEKGRLSLLKIILEKPNLLIMDEPTNHLDISSKEVVEEFLQDFPGTILMVSHDRYLLDSITTRTLELENGRLNSYLGNYSYYREKKADLERLRKEKLQTEVKKSTQVQKKDKPKINKSKLKEEIKNLENDIELLEEKIDFLSGELAKPENYQDEEKGKQMVAEYKNAEAELPRVYEKWEEKIKLLESS